MRKRFACSQRRSRLRARRSGSTADEDVSRGTRDVRDEARAAVTVHLRGAAPSTSSPACIAAELAWPLAAVLADRRRLAQGTAAPDGDEHLASLALTVRCS